MPNPGNVRGAISIKRRIWRKVRAGRLVLLIGDRVASPGELAAAVTVIVACSILLASLTVIG